MSEADAQDLETPAATPAEPDLPSLTAGKLCHDFIGQVGAIISGLDLLEDESAADMRDDAMAMIATSARKLAALIEFDRIAYGASGGAEGYANAELEKLTRAVFGHMKPELDWRIDTELLSKAAAKSAMGLAQIAGAALIAGGTVKVRGGAAGGRFVLQIEGTGPKCRMKAEALAGLRGEGPGEGLAGQWIQATLIQRQIAGRDGRIVIEVEDDRLLFACEMAA
ncbi:MAG: hypothetical protein JWM33_3807 [Caulobacteraceae bacterium]|nr:hypothetical protein [Caulobacteraceae bacterium]